MKSVLLGIIILSIINITGIGYTQTNTSPPVGYRQPVISLVRPNKTTLAQYEKFELTIVLTAQLKNPFDTDEIVLDARIKGPDGKSVTVPGFYYQEFQRTLRENKEELSKHMEANWKIRFTPTLPGRYSYYISVQDKYRVIRSDSFDFMVTPSKEKGFIKVSKIRPYYFEFENGEPYFAIGHNVSWGSSSGTYDYDRYFEKMNKAGENYNRLWMCSWSLGLEYPTKLDPGYDGLGRYHLGNAYRLDYILDLAEKKGIYIMLCIDTFSNLRLTDPYPQFKDYPYSHYQAGPCQNPEEFFTNQKAKEYYKKRVRYIIARWGYSPNLLSWELWNEVDLTENYNSDAVTKWHQEMAQYIREIDPHNHLITTSFSNSRGDDKIWSLAEIDYVQTHLYNIFDTAESVRTWCEQKYQSYKKPHLFGEIGVDVNGKLENTEKEGIYLHNGNWAAAMSHCAGTPMSWWWDNYIEPNNLYKRYTGLAKYVKEIPWNRVNFKNLEYTPLRFTTPPVPEKFLDAIIRPTGGWGDKTGISLFHVNTKGILEEKAPLNTFIHGTTKKDLVTSHKFSVDFPMDGKCFVNVHQVSQHALLKILVDGQVVFTHEFKPTSGKGEWKEEVYNEPYKVYQNIYDKDYTIDIKQGKHTIEFVNEGNDWINVSYITLTNYISSSIPNLRIMGFQSDSNAYFWIQNKDNTWINRTRKITLNPVKNATFEISGLKNGRYKLDWYNTDDASIRSTWTLTNLTGTIPISVPEIRTDIAAKLYHIGD